MGVPGLFAALKRMIPKAFTSNQPEQNVFSDIYIDGNGMLYPIAENNKDPQSIAKSILEACQDYGNMYNCKVHFYLDGPAHMAKIRQQRLRRFQYPPVTLDPKSGLPWSPAMFTPGTPMMDAIHEELMKLKSNYSRLGIYSPSSEPGEGEHKILDRIRSIESKQGKKIGIVGMDADLILLSMPLASRNIIIFRHTNMDINGNLIPDIYRVSDPMIYIDVNILTSQIHSKIGAISIWNFIILTFFIGNDFLPPIPECSKVQDSLDAFLKYMGDGILDNKGNIVWQKVAELSQKLLVLKPDSKWTGLDQGKTVLPDLFPQYYYDIESPFHIEGSEIVSAWKKGIEWNYSYYLKGPQETRIDWQYTSSFAPALLDVARFSHIALINWDTSIKLEPLTQKQALAIVLPPHLHNLLDSETRKRLPKEYYPFSFILRHGYPILPYIPYEIAIKL